MSEEEQVAINAKLDMMLSFLEREREDRVKCREHCDTAMPAVYDRINMIQQIVDRMRGAFGMHHWLLFAAELTGIAVLIYFGVHK